MLAHGLIDNICFPVFKNNYISIILVMILFIYVFN